MQIYFYQQLQEKLERKFFLLSYANIFLSAIANKIRKKIYLSLCKTSVCQKHTNFKITDAP